MQDPAPRKQNIRALFDRIAPERASWIARNRYFYDEDIRYLRFHIPEGASILELGCGTGFLLDALKPARGVGVDLSRAMVEQARTRYPHLEFVEGDFESPELIESLDATFDYIIVSDTIGMLEDCETTLGLLHGLCHADTRLIIAYYSQYWTPLLGLGEHFGLKMPQPEQNWLHTDDTMALLALADFESIIRDWRTLCPRRLFGLGSLVNRYIAPLPLIRRLSLRNYVIARPLRDRPDARPSATVLIPCKNERGNVAAAVERLPTFCPDLEILFVEGGSRDGTRDEIDRVIAAHPDRNIRVIEQSGSGKGAAVRTGFAQATGEVLMILDGDLTVPPESLPRFYSALVNGKGEFINGSRLVYPMENEAMRFLNLVANHLFSRLFSWLLNQRFTDTLCGTKVLRKRHYDRIVANRDYFGEFDPFGDFDLIFGAAKLDLKVVEIPVRYAARTYGETQISRFQHGLLLMRMVLFAFRKMKAI